MRGVSRPGERGIDRDIIDIERSYLLPEKPDTGLRFLVFTGNFRSVNTGIPDGFMQGFS